MERIIWTIVVLILLGFAAINVALDKFGEAICLTIVAVAVWLLVRSQCDKLSDRKKAQ